MIAGVIISGVFFALGGDELVDNAVDWVFELFE